MATDILIRFLNAGLINVGGDDAKLDRLKATAADLASSLKATPSKAARFALIAFDPEAPTEDPVIKEVVEALQNRWTTYVNTFSGTPVAVIRAMLLDALAQAADDDARVAVAFVTSARNALPFMEVGNELAIWADVVSNIEQRVDARAEGEWATPQSIKVSALAFPALPKIEISTSAVTLDKVIMAKKLQATVGPNNAAGQATGGNPHWPTANGPWVTEFGTRSAEVIAEAVGALAKESKIDPIDLSAPLKGIAQAVSAHVAETLQAVSGATAGLQRRTNLIWWKETLYSPSVRVSYRDMPSSTAAALMAFDLHQQVPTFSPASVAAFLHEAVLSLPHLDSTNGKSIREFLNEAIVSPELAPVRAAAKRLVQEPLGRGPILSLLGYDTGQQRLEDERFRALVGISAPTTLTAPQWAIWLFREFQAARATQEEAEATKQGLKSP